MDPDTKMRESMRVPRKSSLDFSCAPTYDSPRGFNSSTRIKNIKNVTKCRDSRAAKSIEIR